MDIDSSHTPNWLYDYGFDVPVAGADLPVVSSGGFNWVSPTFHGSSDTSLDLDYSLENSTFLESGPSKRLKSESCASGSKACREKLRRDRLNERFLELSSILEPGKLPKMDKTAILSDAVRMLTELRTEAQKLKETNDELLEKIKELKAEKNELRDEKNRLKMDKEKLEQRVKGMNAQPTYLSHPSAAFSAQGQTASHKLIPFVGYPGIGMWQFLPPAAVDTSRDHLLRPPVA
ncbi:transcription factor ILR3-like isoform X1 [Prosopis cineraria]|uniref:transcription factor ILR3-like isoform X1 n=1 Tax=Prosopis cineraria TaxID=364024 RepID=UPI00240F844C|nr:transcription factor ILR3-like isoform X1 [Prosopis cineraria]XP_054814265.1 transcription factor ILR3-like isoform X1 [Prosopis cineraria]